MPQSHALKAEQRLQCEVMPQLRACGYGGFGRYGLGAEAAVTDGAESLPNSLQTNGSLPTWK